ncbi:MAG TPA: hypothetical protein PKH10_03975 [bacterium]|nr:hypothetical protein [bacterium]
MGKALTSLSKELKIDLPNLVLHLASLGAPLEGIWPEVDKAWLAYLVNIDWGKFGEKESKGKQEVDKEKEVKDEGALERAKIVFKLDRKSFYGARTVSKETMKNHFFQDMPNFEKRMEELLELAYLLKDKEGKYALNMSKKKNIENMVAVYVEEKEAGSKGP